MHCCVHFHVQHSLQACWPNLNLKISPHISDFVEVCVLGGGGGRVMGGGASLKKPLGRIEDQGTRKTKHPNHARIVPSFFATGQRQIMPDTQGDPNGGVLKGAQKAPKGGESQGQEAYFYLFISRKLLDSSRRVTKWHFRFTLIFRLRP